MIVRPFDWRDILALHRFRHQTVFLDSALVLTRGSMLFPRALFSYLAPGMGIYTAVSTGGKKSGNSLLGQITFSSAPYAARLTFLTPETAIETSALPALLDHLAGVAGRLGTYRLLADVDEDSRLFEALRYCSFSTFTRQRIWRLVRRPALEDGQPSTWRMAMDRDTFAVRSLYNNLVPGLIQQFEPISTQQPRGLVYYQDNELLGYIELKYGAQGIWAQPFIHPDTENVRAKFLDFFQRVPNNRRSRPVYLCIRSYQSWLESALEDLGAEPSHSQAVMAKHMVVSQKAIRVFSLPALERGCPEVSAPIANMGRK